MFSAMTMSFLPSFLPSIRSFLLDPHNGVTWRPESKNVPSARARRGDAMRTFLFFRPSSLFPFHYFHRNHTALQSVRASGLFVTYCSVRLDEMAAHRRRRRRRRRNNAGLPPFFLALPCSARLFVGCSQKKSECQYLRSRLESLGGGDVFFSSPRVLSAFFSFAGKQDGEIC